MTPTIIPNMVMCGLHDIPVAEFQYFSSLVSRLFLPPVFDRLQYAKMEEEGLGERVTCVTSGRREGGGAQSL